MNAQPNEETESLGFGKSPKTISAPRTDCLLCLRKNTPLTAGRAHIPQERAAVSVQPPQQQCFVSNPPFAYQELEKSGIGLAPCQVA